jgi:hypothetical protein
VRARLPLRPFYLLHRSGARANNSAAARSDAWPWTRVAA